MSRVLKGIKEIAEFIGESEDATWRLLKGGHLPAFRHHPKAPWRMRESDYLAYLASIVRKPAA